MFDFSEFVNLPLIWGGIIAFAIFLYVLLDGFDLGIGIIFPFAPSHNCRSKMMNSVVPFWDGNETWLVLGGGGLLSAFPLAYSIIMPAFYAPIILMLIGLIFRGVAFEFRFKAVNTVYWDYVFHFGSLIAAFMQGAILGAYIQGIKVENDRFAGGSFDWLNGFSVITGISLIFGYALLGSTWVIIKTDEETNKWARRTALYALTYVVVGMVIVSLWVPFLDNDIWRFWFSIPNIFYLSIIPLITLFLFVKLTKSLKDGDDSKPFILSITIFMLAYLGLALSLWPYIVPHSITITEAAASNQSLSLLLIGVIICLPTILAYTAYSYYIFRGKAIAKAFYE